MRRFQSERFIFSVKSGAIQHKIFQVAFGNSDGSLYVFLPYFAISEGILSEGTIPANETQAEISLRVQGKVTSHKVKYAHHPDGEAHFSQSGKVRTEIAKRALPLARAEGHIFTLYAQGLTNFTVAKPGKDGKSPEMKRTVLTFNFDAGLPSAIKLVGRWYEDSSLLARAKGRIVKAATDAQTPDGKITQQFVVGPPLGAPMEKYVLLVGCEQIPLLDEEHDAKLIFIGGFDPPSNFADSSNEAKFICVSYPVSDHDRLAKELGSIDIV